MAPEFAYEVLFSPDEGRVHVVAEGNISLQDLKQMYSSVLTDEQYEDGMGRLWDFTHLDVSLITSDQLKAFAHFMMQEDLGVDTARSAILVGRDLEYGMVRMLQALGDGVLSPNVLVTRSRDEALAWTTKRNADDLNK